jgi:hypothetical protein
LQHLGRGRDLDRIGDFSDLESEIQANRLLNLDLNVTADRLKACLFHFDVVQTWGHRRKGVDSRICRQGSPHSIRGEVGERDSRTGHHAAARIGDVSRYLAERLSVQKCR